MSFVTFSRVQGTITIASAGDKPRDSPPVTPPKTPSKDAPATKS